MKAEFKSKEKNIATFTMEFSSDEFDAALDEAFKANRNRYPIDGFRKGKAPRKLIEAHYGAGVFFDDAVNALLSTNYGKTLDDLKIEAIAPPEIDLSDLDAGKAFTATIKVETYPEFEVKDYKGVKVKREEKKILKADVDKEMEILLKRNSRMEVVEGPAKDGDMVLMDFSGSVDGKKFDGGSAEHYPLKLGSNMFIPGFEEQLIGLSAGEEKDVEVTFPEDYGVEQLAGKPAVFSCKVHEVKREEMPTLDDEFAKDVSEFDTLAELKADTKKKLQEKAAEEADKKVKSDAMDEVMKNNDIDVPDIMVEDEIDMMIKEFDNNLKMQGMNLENYLKFVEGGMETFRSDISGDARNRVKNRMIIKKIAEQEDFAVTDAEIDEELESLGKQYNMELAKVKEVMGEQLDSVKENIKFKKAVNFVSDNAAVEK